MENNWRFLKKLKTELSYDLAIAFLSIYLEKILIQKDTSTPLFIVAKTWKQPKCPPTDKWIKKMWCVYTHTHRHTDTHTRILLSDKKNEILPFAATWMDLEIIILSEVNQTEKDKHCMMPLKWGILKNDTDELI